MTDASIDMPSSLWAMWPKLLFLAALPCFMVYKVIGAIGGEAKVDVKAMVIGFVVGVLLWWLLALS
jgi:hypothetical protein